MSSGDVVMGTEWAKRIVGGARVFETSAWKLFLVRGDSDERLGSNHL
jgi:hypothetical protein